MEDCIFCQIVAGDIPSRTVYEDEHAFAFLDVNPLAPGHTLVIPKSHHETLGELPDEGSAALAAAVHEVAPAVEAAMDADATTVACNNGEAAGQEVPHVHYHVVPRYEGDGYGPIHALFDGPTDVSDDELDDIADDIGAALD
ncbi:HIT family protein [Haloarchaeobius litoreus]|uniref:HIT family protein n=1 Tax=Haloarchaeobius litoreus TaxID=755306 RepID=A0ABD6DK43_9EURY|nr:HIT family protein [Haloarchaeobius litoreus]